MFAGRPETVDRQIMDCYAEAWRLRPSDLHRPLRIPDAQEAEKSIRLFATEVLPRLNEAAPAVAA